MEKESRQIPRKNFLKIGGGALLGALIAPEIVKSNAFAEEGERYYSWPEMSIEDVPDEMDRFRKIYNLIPKTELSDEGWLVIPNSSEKVDVLETEYNATQINEEIYEEVGGVQVETMVLLQKTCDMKENFDNTGHFLITEKDITQTKFPSENGRPQIAWGINWVNSQEKNMYANALYGLTWEKDFQNTFNPTLIKMFRYEPPYDIRRRAIAINIDGEIGDDIEASDELMANILSVLLSLKKYGINPWDMVCNHELYGSAWIPDKDIGIETMAELRHYLGLITLIDGTSDDKKQMFAHFAKSSEVIYEYSSSTDWLDGTPSNPQEPVDLGSDLRPYSGELEAVKRFFRANREYLKQVLTAREFQDWDAKTKYHFLMDLLEGKEQMPIADKFIHPIENDSGGGYGYKDETEDLFSGEMSGYHTGHDYNIGFGNEDEGMFFQCAGNGKVVYAGTTTNGMGNTIIVKHRLPDGSEVYSRYGHCKDINVKEGDIVSLGDKIGTIGRTGYEYHDKFFAHLHFDMAYSKTYEEFMVDRPEYYDHDSKEWIGRRWIYPKEFIAKYKDKVRLYLNELEEILKEMHLRSRLPQGVR